MHFEKVASGFEMNQQKKNDKNININKALNFNAPAKKIEKWKHNPIVSFPSKTNENS